MALAPESLEEIYTRSFPPPSIFDRELHKFVLTFLGKIHFSGMLIPAESSRERPRVVLRKKGIQISDIIE